MSNNAEIRRRPVFEWVLNAATLALVAFMAVGIAMNRFGTPAKARPSNTIRIGQTVPLPGVDWSRSRYTLILALSSSCHFCSESASFYRAILAGQRNRQWQAIGVFPQSADAIKRYTGAFGYSLPEVRQGDLGALGVAATPTLLLVDQNGRLQQQWIGVLTAAEEDDLASHLGIEDWSKLRERAATDGTGMPAADETSPIVTTRELADMLQREKRINLIDVRERSAYAYGRIAASANIPADELEVRASHELLDDAPTILYCQFSAACAAAGRSSLCSSSAAALASIGMTNVRVLRDPIPLLKEAGLPIVGASDRP